MSPIFDFFFDPYRERDGFFIVLEALAFVFGIASVILAKRESILVYPTGLVATVITMYLFFKDKLLGDMMINLYYSLMSIYGWWNWSRRKEGETVVHITRTNRSEKSLGFILFLGASGLNYFIYRIFDVAIETSNYVDILTSGIFFTAMWYMATKKLENWTLWILADLITIPLYAYRGWGMLSLQYFIFTILAIQGYREWKKRLDKNLQTS
ncbi:nicotinamide riboside transporter PnuC [Robiginitalea aurantiaca]|uniref:Nicotinamide riboside transporter PnuC n=1 Tax=Robiginitalea aurantiaca TaxID=3056915 RepID=A0ABT7WEV5_9FLAO|nr:nicotinamide riboside transporter PnuC [Robiginitalea aurantiaca]MDM9631344.1 nicotinamide riboside transporter PnuC [Robiginitalea aurantiaca]